VILFAQVPYFLVHFCRTRGKRKWTHAQNLFYDYFVTPVVTFLPRDLIEEWCAAQGARVVLYDENQGSNVHSFILTKRIAETEKEDARPHVHLPQMAGDGKTA
jgi:hypothetical protein